MQASNLPVFQQSSQGLPAMCPEHKTLLTLMSPQENSISQDVFNVVLEDA